MKTNSCNSLAFGVKIKFLRNQPALPCAYCGKPILSKMEFDDIYKALRDKKGAGIVPILFPLLDRLDGEAQSFLSTILHCAQDSKYQDWNFRHLAMLGKEKKFYTTNDRETLAKIVKDIGYSVEHTNPQSLGGINHSSNYLPMHVGCNGLRSSHTYTEMSELNPQFPANIKKCLAELRRRMISDGLGQTNYNIRLQDDYFPSVTESVVAQGIDRSLLVDA